MANKNAKASGRRPNPAGAAPASGTALTPKEIAGMLRRHVWMILFMTAVFHVPLAVFHTFSIKAEARILGSLILFWMIEDFLWFVLNPAFGIRRFRDKHIEWHKRWVGPVPLDYIVACAAGGALLTYSFMSRGAGV